jgi:hypothetical protein
MTIPNLDRTQETFWTCLVPVLNPHQYFLSMLSFEPTMRLSEHDEYHTKLWTYLVSISPIFFISFFRTKVFCAAFMCLQFGFVIFWQKDFGAKAAHKMLMKLTLGCFLTILRLSFQSSPRLSRYTSSHFWGLVKYFWTFLEFVLRHFKLD